MNNIKGDLEELFEEFDKIDSSRRLSSLMRSYGVINYTYNVKNYGLKEAIRNYLSLGLEFINYLLKGESVLPISSDLPILTFMSPRPHLFRINSLVAVALNNHFTKAYFYNPGFSAGLNAYSFREGRKKILSPFDESMRGIIGPAVAQFKYYLNKTKQSQWHVVPFRIHLYRQFSALFYYKEFFKQKSIPFVLCEYDQYNEIAALILAAKEEGIPTYTQTHGLLNSQLAYTPLIAENIFVWGQYHKELLKSWGIDEANIHVCGAVQYQQVEDLNPTRSSLLKSYGLKKRVISLATNPMQSEIKEALILFVEALVALLPKEWSLVLRPHPSEQIEPYGARLESKGVKVFDNSLMPIQDLLGLSDCVMVWNSAFAVDALVNKIPTVHINLNGIKSDGEVIRLVGEKLIPTFSKPSELVEYFKLFHSQSPERFCIQKEDYDKFKQVYCVATGEEAAENINKHLSQHIN